MGKNKKEQQVERIEKKPCGCVVTHFKDGGGKLKPCPACGIMEAARCAAEMGNALASVADHMRRQFNQATLGAAVAEVMAKKEAEKQEEPDGVQSDES